VVFLQDLEKKYKEFRDKVGKDWENIAQSGKMELNSNLMCKKYRETFPEVDSKLIFDHINDLVKNHRLTQSNSSTQQNETLTEEKLSSSSQTSFASSNPSPPTPT